MSGHHTAPVAPHPMFIGRTALLLWLALPAVACRAQVATNFWTGASDSDWFSASNWSLLQEPQAGQAVVIDADHPTAFTNVLLTNSTPRLYSIEIASRMLTFSNWATTLQADDVYIRGGAAVTLPSAFTNGGVSNRINIACTNLTLDGGGQINADARGFKGGYDTPGHGPGGGGSSSGWGGGGGHGGRGGNPQGIGGGGAMYGSAADPSSPGSGGGGSSAWGGYGGSGGGAVRIVAGARVRIDGLITANGGPATNGVSVGGGSGGGVFIGCSYVDAASTGTVQASGGSGAGTGGGRGGGGRIAIRYDAQAQAGQTPAIRLLAATGSGGYVAGGAQPAEIGSVFIPDQQFLSTSIVGTNANVYGVSCWEHQSLTFTNCRWILCGPGTRTVVAQSLIIGTNGFLGIHLENTRLDCRDLILTNGGRLAVYSGVTNASTDTYGARVSVTDAVWVGANSWIYPYSDPTNGGSVLFALQRLTLAGGTNGGIDATGRGFAGLKGYGAGATDASHYGGGGAHGGKGGKGGNTSPAGGKPYDATNAPIHPGSGAGGDYGAIVAGGGLIRIEAQGAVVANGVIRANGGTGVVSGNGGGGGGGIWIMCASFSGDASGVLEARGGNGWVNGGGGGGGRIAIWCGIPEYRRADIVSGIDQTAISPAIRKEYAGFISVTNGTGFFNGAPNGAEPGTFVFLKASPRAIILSVR